MHESARFTALKNWVLTTDRHQSIRMVMTGSAAVIAAGCIAITNLAAVAGSTPAGWMLVWSLVTCMGFLVPLVLIRSGRTQHLRDPALTQFQVRFALLSNTVAYVLLGPARGISLVLLSLIMLFAVFDVSPRQMAANIAYALACLASPLPPWRGWTNRTASRWWKGPMPPWSSSCCWVLPLSRCG